MSKKNKQEDCCTEILFISTHNLQEYMAYEFISPTSHFVIAPLKGLVKGFCSKLLVNMSKSLIFVLDYILCTCSLVQGGLETGKACEQCLA